MAERGFNEPVKARDVSFEQLQTEQMFTGYRRDRRGDGTVLIIAALAVTVFTLLGFGIAVLTIG